MFAKIVKGKDLASLESEVNKFLSDCKLIPEHQPDEKTFAEQLREHFPGLVPNEAMEKISVATIPKRLKIYNVQQFVIGEVDPKTVSLINQQPVPTYSFCLLLICGYE